VHVEAVEPFVSQQSRGSRRDRRGRRRGELRACLRRLGRKHRDHDDGDDAVDHGRASVDTGATAGAPWGHQRSDETLLTGDALAKVTAIAKDKVSGGTVIRVETDADGHAAYEAHMTKADGTPVTVYVDSSFQFVSME